MASKETNTDQQIVEIFEQYPISRKGRGSLLKDILDFFHETHGGIRCDNCIFWHSRDNGTGDCRHDALTHITQENDRCDMFGVLPEGGA